MTNTVCLLFRDAPMQLGASRQMRVDGIDCKLSAVAFYDIFEQHRILEEFVESIARGGVEEPHEVARILLKNINDGITKVKL